MLNHANEDNKLEPMEQERKEAYASGDSPSRTL